MMTGYERYQREQAQRQLVRELWNPPLDTAVMNVETTRPMKSGKVGIRMPSTFMRGPTTLLRGHSRIADLLSKDRDS